MYLPFALCAVPVIVLLCQSHLLVKVYYDSYSSKTRYSYHHARCAKNAVRISCFAFIIICLGFGSETWMLSHTWKNDEVGNFDQLLFVSVADNWCELSLSRVFQLTK